MKKKDKLDALIKQAIAIAEEDHRHRLKAVFAFGDLCIHAHANLDLLRQEVCDKLAWQLGRNGFPYHSSYLREAMILSERVTDKATRQLLMKKKLSVCDTIELYRPAASSFRDEFIKQLKEGKVGPPYKLRDHFRKIGIIKDKAKHRKVVDHGQRHFARSNDRPGLIWFDCEDEEYTDWEIKFAALLKLTHHVLIMDKLNAAIDLVNRGRAPKHRLPHYCMESELMRKVS